MPSSSSDESVESSHVRKKHKKDKADRSREETMSSSKSRSEKKKEDRKERDDSDRLHHRSTERKHEKKSKYKKWRSSSDSDGDAEPSEMPKRNTSNSESKRASDRDKSARGGLDEASTRSASESKRHRGGRSGTGDRIDYRSTGSTASGGYEDNRKESSYSSYKRSRDNDDVRERSDKRSEHRQQYGPSDRPKSYYNRAEKTPPWKRRRDEEGDEKQSRPAWATNRVIEHAEQIQKRKLLWQRPTATVASSDGAQDVASTSASGAASSSSSSTAPSKNWANMLAATGGDEKSIDKFKRLMGIRDQDGKAASTSSDAVEAERHRQEALYRDLDQQYNIARSVTHTGRGKGLGFF